MPVNLAFWSTQDHTVRANLQFQRKYSGKPGFVSRRICTIAVQSFSDNNEYFPDRSYAESRHGNPIQVALHALAREGVRISSQAGHHIR